MQTYIIITIIIIIIIDYNEGFLNSSGVIKAKIIV